MDDLLLEYLPILVFLGIALGLGLVLLFAAAVIAIRNPDPEKVSAYECGFNAFDDARMKFDVRFYLVSILFIMLMSLKATAQGNKNAISRSKMINKIETK